MEFIAIGDIHGHQRAWDAMKRKLRIESNPPDSEEIFYIFLGDLIDGKDIDPEDSLQMAKKVKSLVEQQRAICLMGNHEYNLLMWELGEKDIKSSNKTTIKHIRSHREQWTPILSFFRNCPLAIRLDDTQLVHACWHEDSLSELQFLKRSGSEVLEDGHPLLNHFEDIEFFDTPFQQGLLRSDLPASKSNPSGNTPVEMVMKGPEESLEDGETFPDWNDEERGEYRLDWWKDRTKSGTTTIFGHYKSFEPRLGEDEPTFVPPHPLDKYDKKWKKKKEGWLRHQGQENIKEGQVNAPDSVRHICIDYQGMKLITSKENYYLGAYNLSNREVSWICR